MQVIKAPNQYDDRFTFTVFLAGSIEMGKAIDWQTELVGHFEDKEVIFLNPRRDSWDSSWVQSINNKEFKTQVSWELEGIENADLVVFVFDPNTLSPITLLELGLVAGLGRNAVIYCPEPFWCKGNVDIVAEQYGLETVDSLEAIVTYISEIST